MTRRTELIAGVLVIAVSVAAALGLAHLVGADAWRVALGLITIAGMARFGSAWFGRREESLALEVVRSSFVAAPVALALTGAMRLFVDAARPPHGWSAAVVLCCLAPSLAWRLTRARDLDEQDPLPGLLAAGLRPDERSVQVRQPARLLAGVACVGTATITWLWAHDAERPEPGLLLGYVLPTTWASRSCGTRCCCPATSS